MIETVTTKQKEEMQKELLEFCTKDWVLMYRYMLTIKQIRKEPEDKLLMERLKKQADEYKKRKKK